MWFVNMLPIHLVCQASVTTQPKLQHQCNLLGSYLSSIYILLEILKMAIVNQVLSAINITFS